MTGSETAAVHLRALQSEVVHEMFVRTADENYITARWCVANELNIDFLWLSLHALEKYLKAVLLKNGLSSIRLGHNIVGIYAKVKEIAGPLLPDRLPKPRDLDIAYWIDVTSEEFLEHLMRFGNADNRYMIYGYNTFSQDLHMVDQLIWAVRRLIVRLDDPFWPDELGIPDRQRDFTYRKVLADNPLYCPSLGALPLDELIRSKNDSPSRAAALNLNFSFAPPGFHHRPMPGGSASYNSVIYSHVFEPLATGDAQQVEMASHLAKWIIENVQLPRGGTGTPGVVDDMEGAVLKARQKHGLA